MKFIIPYQTEKDCDFYVSQFRSNPNMLMFLIDLEFTSSMSDEAIESWDEICENTDYSLDIVFNEDNMIIKHARVNSINLSHSCHIH